MITPNIIRLDTYPRNGMIARSRIFYFEYFSPLRNEEKKGVSSDLIFSQFSFFSIFCIAIARAIQLSKKERKKERKKEGEGTCHA